MIEKNSPDVNGNYPMNKKSLSYVCRKIPKVMRVLSACMRETVVNERETSYV